MVIKNRQLYLLGLVLVTSLSANIQFASAITTDPVRSSEDSEVLLSTSQMMKFITVLDKTVKHPVRTGLSANNHAEAGKFISTETVPYGTNLLMLAGKSQQSKENTGKALTDTVSNPSDNQHSGSFVSTNYNTLSMLRKMEDLQNIGYLDMNNTEPISDALTRELKATTEIALVPHNSCANLEGRKPLLACQDKDVDKAMAMPMVYDRYWSPQMTKNYSFWYSSNNSTAK